MNGMKTFEKKEFGKIRTVTIGGEPWFVGKDVAGALEYKDTKNALKAHVDSDDKRGWQITTPGGEQNMTIINESGVYSLIFGSRLPSARRFKRWVTSEVLPSIRETGGYGQADLTAACTEAVRQMAPLFRDMAREAMQSAMGERIPPGAQGAGRETCGPARAFENTDSYGAARCKLETFPQELTARVDELLENMLDQQNLNFSMIARFCTVNGYPISSPSVKTYFQKHFSGDL